MKKILESGLCLIVISALSGCGQATDQRLDIDDESAFIEESSPKSAQTRTVEKNRTPKIENLSPYTGDIDLDTQALNSWNLGFEAFREGTMSKADMKTFMTYLSKDQLFPALEDANTVESIFNLDPAMRAMAMPDSDVVLDYLHGALNTMIDNPPSSVGDPGDRGRYYAWYWGYHGRTALYQYKSSGDVRFLDLFVSSYMKMLDLRDDALNLIDDERGIIFPGWGTKYKNGKRANEVTVMGLTSLPTCIFLQYAQAQPEITARYNDEIETMREKTLDGLRAFLPEYKVNTEGPGGYYYHMSEDYLEPLNHMHVYAAALSKCSAFAEGEFENVVKGISEYFLASVTNEESGAWSWPYQPLPEDMHYKGSEATWKGAVTIEFPIAAFEEGLIFEDSDMESIAATFTENIAEPKGIGKFIGKDKSQVVSDPDTVKLPTYFQFGLNWLFYQCYQDNLRKEAKDLVLDNPGFFKGGVFETRMIPMVMSYATWNKGGGECLF